MWIKWVGDGAVRADVEDVEGGGGAAGGNGVPQGWGILFWITLIDRSIKSF